ncbi:MULTISPECIES: hypothetical protein [Enterococcus]|uniref:hypothetical protein n=1 Tax=Enterococcus TaxID=1350 RepID=UPI0011640069|nr:hypothetical protein [Enterococcus avium]HAP3020841.1 hypothetical protein [Enterococcus faecalis]AYQ24268.1 hypothetical protein AUF16_06725 [Enterococcus avium]HBI1561754.1 hypothetical protein [Enterococcus faecalis]HBI1564802.1 hypothetical protein [Enterococcus faecalis]HBI1717965.1 hypothetical protein [Enterococcus faecalis]
MQENVTVWKRICLIVASICLVMIIVVIGIHVEGKKERQRQEEKIEVLEGNIKKANQRYEQLSAQKNNTQNDSLVHAATAVFSSLFNYDSEKDTLKERREKAREFVSEEALEEIFPKEATSYQASVQSVSRIHEPIAIYYSAIKDKKQNVFILIKNTVSIAGSTPQEAQFTYRAEYDPLRNQFVSIESMGTLNE